MPVKGNDYLMSGIDYEIVRFEVYKRTGEAVSAARVAGRSHTRVEIWRELCRISQPRFELKRMLQDAHLAAARNYVRSAERHGIKVEIGQHDNVRGAYWIDLDISW